MVSPSLRFRCPKYSDSDRELVVELVGGFADLGVSSSSPAAADEGTSGLFAPSPVPMVMIDEVNRFSISIVVSPRTSSSPMPAYPTAAIVSNTSVCVCLEFDAERFGSMGIYAF